MLASQPAGLDEPQASRIARWTHAPPWLSRLLAGAAASRDAEKPPNRIIGSPDPMSVVQLADGVWPSSYANVATPPEQRPRVGEQRPPGGVERRTIGKRRTGGGSGYGRAKSRDRP